MSLQHQARFCMSCGTSIPAGANFCASCGTQAGTPGTQDRKSVDQPSGTLEASGQSPAKSQIVPGCLAAIAVMFILSMASSYLGVNKPPPDEPRVVDDPLPPAQPPIDPSESPWNSHNQGSRTVTTAKGRFSLATSAWLDGRDLESRPPLTLMRINVWGSPGPVRGPVRCRLPHGAEVMLEDARFVSEEGRNYFEITGKSCRGWVPETFLASKKHAPVGEKM